LEFTSGKDERGEEDDEIIIEYRDKTRSNQMKVPRKSLMELLLICSPLIHATCIAYPVLYYLSLDFPILLISVFPTQSKNVWTICLCLSWELFSFSIILAWSIYELIMIISFVLAFKDSAELATRRISR